MISLHGGGSPEAMKQEIWRNYPVGNKVELVERLLERGVLAEPGRKIASERQPGRCCDSGCMVPGAPQMVPLPKPSAARRKIKPAAGKAVKKLSRIDSIAPILRRLAREKRRAPNHAPNSGVGALFEAKSLVRA